MRSLSKAVFSYFRQESGASVIIFAMVLPVALVAVGGALDFAISHKSRVTGQNAVDAATLAYVNDYLANANEQSALREGKRYFAENKDLNGWAVEFSDIREENGRLVASASATVGVETVLLHLADIERMTVKVNSEVSVPIRSISAVVVPDVSASMRGPHLNAVKDAIVTFGNEMFDLPAPFARRLNMGMVPYAGSVNVSSASRDVTQLLTSWSYSSPDNRDYKSKRHYLDGGGCNPSIRDRHDEVLDLRGRSAEYAINRHSWEQREIVDRREVVEDGERRIVENRRREWACVNKGTVRVQPWSGCLQTTRGEFDPTHLLTSGSSRPLPPTTHSSDGPHCPSSQSAMRADVRSKGEYSRYARQLQNGFSTAHDVGLLWAARLLEPTWASFFDVVQRPWRDETFPKYLVFLSDGASVDIGYTFGDYVGRNREEINRNVTRLCNYLKSRDVTIYGISYFRTSRPDGIPVVEGCASRDKHYSGTSSNIEEIFENIATEIKTEGLRIQK